MNNNPTIARLLAKENLTVQHGNYKTAWFDIKNRVLGLPIWKDMGKDVYDLFVGHEIGHALYTPYEGWHDSPEKIDGVPRSYLNVVEDARIEKFARRDYPGLVGPFLRGYQALVERDFFGPLDDLDWEQIKLIDKINLKAKLESNIKVPFNSEEKNLFNKVMSTETFEEVVELCKEILAYTQENTPELITKPEPQPQEEGIPNEENDEAMSNDIDPSPQGHDDYDKPEDSGDVKSEEEDKVEQESTDADGDGTDEEPKEESTENSSTDKDKEDDTSVEEDRSLTDEIQRESERNLIDLDEYGNQAQFARAPCKELIDNAIISFKELSKQRQEAMRLHNFNIEESGIMEGYEEYLNGVKKSARFAIKEFELRKAAFQWQRAATAKTGSLDMNKVHSYRYNEEIFARVTRLANAKNHGMVMLIDYSGSMGSTIDQVIDQLFHLITFCKGVNIPFDVYAFTTGNHLNDDQIPLLKDGDINLDDLSLPLLVSSSFKKAEYEEALKFLYMKKQANRSNRYNRHSWDDQWWNDYTFSARAEEWGSTPLNAALIVAHTLIKKFKARHNLDKTNLVVLSDGDSNQLRTIHNRAFDHIKTPTKSTWGGGMNIHIDGKLINIEDSGRRGTAQILENLRKRYQINTIGFFVSQQPHDFRSKLYEIDRVKNGRESWIDLSIFNTEYRKNKCVTMKNALGYNEFYLVKGGKAFSADTSEEDFDVKEEASNAQIRTAFKKFSKNKKLNKVLMTNFGRAVA